MNTKAKEVLNIARNEIGVKESPSGSNNVKYNTWYYGHKVYGPAYPWCMVFVQWVMNQSDVDAPIKTASCGVLMRAAKKENEWITADYMPGDVVIYNFSGGSSTDHTGIIESYDGDYVVAIEGNTSVNNASNGGEVRRMKRKANTIVGAWRPYYNTIDEDDDEMTKEQFAEYMDEYLKDLQSQPGSTWSAEDRQWAIDNGLIKGDENGNAMWLSFITREQIAALFHRFEGMI